MDCTFKETNLVKAFENIGLRNKTQNEGTNIVIYKIRKI